MRLQLTVLRLHSGATERDSTYVFDESGGTIGRSATCDWSLSDQSRTLSSVHAQISHNGHGFSITDTSTNGVYLNRVDVPLGRYKSAPLNDGDTLYLAGFVISVAVLRSEGERAVAPAPPRLPAAPARKPIIPEEFDFGDLGASHSAHPPAALAEKPPVDASIPTVTSHSPAAKPTRPAHPPASVAVGGTLASLMAYSPWSRWERPSAPVAPSADIPPASAQAIDRDEPVVVAQVVDAHVSDVQFPHVQVSDAQVFWAALGIDPALLAPSVREGLLAGLGTALRDAARGLMAALPQDDVDAIFAAGRMPAPPASTPNTGVQSSAQAGAKPQPARTPGMTGHAAA